MKNKITLKELAKLLNVSVSTVSTLAVPFIAVLADALVLASFPNWNDTAALTMVALAVVLALTEAKRKKMIEPTKTPQ